MWGTVVARKWIAPKTETREKPKHIICILIHSSYLQFALLRANLYEQFCNVKPHNVASEFVQRNNFDSKCHFKIFIRNTCGLSFWKFQCLSWIRNSLKQNEIRVRILWWSQTVRSHIIKNDWKWNKAFRIPTNREWKTCTESVQNQGLHFHWQVLPFSACVTFN